MVTVNEAITLPAAGRAHQEIVKLVIEPVANVNLRDDRSDNRFLYAGAEGYSEI